MATDPIYRGWGLAARLGRKVKRSFTNVSKLSESAVASVLASEVTAELAAMGLADVTGRQTLAEHMAEHVLASLVEDDDTALRKILLFQPLAQCCHALIEYEGLFALPEDIPLSVPDRSALWETEDQLNRIKKVLANLDAAMGDLAEMVLICVQPFVEQCPVLLQAPNTDNSEISFDTQLADNLSDLPDIIEPMVQVPTAPEFEEYQSTVRLQERLAYNLIVASGGVPSDPRTIPRMLKLPTKIGPMSARKLIDTYLTGTPWKSLFDITVPITIPQTTRFEHQMIVAGSGHGKTQTLQHLILHDLEAVLAGQASIVVIDSQTDLINNIAGLKVFAPGQPLADRLCLIDPTDVEWPVALNLFDVGMERINQYSQLDREKLINGIIELYDFVLGTLLDAGMTQKQSVIFRYITRLLLHIPNATIQTFRELLEEGGAAKYQEHIAKLTGTPRAFFENEYDGKEFTQTRKQVLRRLYGVLENQSFERMFSHPKSKLDLFSEMNAGKVILINTAKDLLKENGAEIFGRFFIAMIAQAAQERAVLPRDKRLPTFVYIDEASDYFDRNIGIILSQARKQNVGILCANQFLGQMDPKLQEAMFANTSIKFAGGVSAKDARTLTAELSTEAGFLESQDKLSFAAHIKGTTKNAVSISVPFGNMEKQERMSEAERAEQLVLMRKKHAVHHSEIGRDEDSSDEVSDGSCGPSDPDQGPEEDDGKPMPWD